MLFLALHDWVPLARLNNIAAVRRVHGVQRILIGTLINAVPFTFGLEQAFITRGQPLPHWLWMYLIISYGILFAGEIEESWWLTYFFGYKEAARDVVIHCPSPSRASRSHPLPRGRGSSERFSPGNRVINHKHHYRADDGDEHQPVSSSSAILFGIRVRAARPFE